MMRVEVVSELTDRFGEFADTCSRFSRDIMRETFGVAHVTHSDHVQLNLRIAQTMFSKWSVDIVSLLYTNRTAGFQEIRKSLGHITSRVLSNKLTKMGRMDLIRREVLPTKPPTVQYSLTEKGLQASKLGEPLFLYLRLTEGLLVEPPQRGARRGRGSSLTETRPSGRG